MFSIRRKLLIIILFTLLLVALINTVWWFNYQRTEEMLESQLSRRLAAIAEIARNGISPLQTDSLVAGDIFSYLEITSFLERIRQADELSEVFILNENYDYLATTTLQPDSLYLLSGLNALYIDSVFISIEPEVVISPAYRTGEIYLKSAFTPLVGTGGYPLAVICVEADVDYFNDLTSLRQNLIYATLISLLGGIVLGLFFLLLQRRIAIGEQKLFLGETHAHLGRMVAVVAHELRNPLMIIRGSAERIKKKTDMVEAEYVVEEVDRLNGIVTGYLDFAKAGGSLLAGDQLQLTDITKMVSQLKTQIRQRYEDKEIVWIGTELTHLQQIKCYPRSLRQVLLNLLINGAEACQEANMDIKVGVDISESGSELTICVHDNGPGFSNYELKQIMTPFHTTKKSGSGLGLYLSRKIVTEMGGSLEIYSQTGHTKIEIKLPKQMEL